MSSGCSMQASGPPMTTYVVRLPGVRRLTATVFLRYYSPAAAGNESLKRNQLEVLKVSHYAYKKCAGGMTRDKSLCIHVSPDGNYKGYDCLRRSSLYAGDVKSISSEAMRNAGDSKVPVGDAQGDWYETQSAQEVSVDVRGPVHFKKPFSNLREAREAKNSDGYGTRVQKGSTDMEGYMHLKEVFSSLSEPCEEVSLPASWKIHNAFHVSFLRQFVGELPDQPEDSPQPEVDELDEVLQPEQILSHKERRQGGRMVRRYLVKFKNYSDMDSKWMEEADLADTPQILELYLEAFSLQPTIVGA
ncbi:hypothetical protein L7F22_035709 [Adiantum nelumboides]|nr:hypothetical protein [Adiantum nelumboides]